MRYYFIVMLSAAFILIAGNAVSSDYQPLSENVFQYVEKEYGPKAEKRLRYLHTLIIENSDLPDMEKVELVNKTLNHLPWIADGDHWKKADYWASPLETITTFGGDCEDISIVKWVVLRHLDISAEHLRLAYVKIKETGENHMVLLYLKNPSAPFEQQESYVLDNYVQEVKKGSERTDLLAVFTIDAKGTIVLIEDKDSNRSVKGVYEERKMKKLDEVIKKIAEDREKFKELNDGRPLFPSA